MSSAEPLVSPTIDRRQAERFLEALTGSSDCSVTFQVFDDANQKDSELTLLVHGTLSEWFDRLAELNQRGAGIFVTVNATDGYGRRTENVTLVRAVFADFDAGGPGSFPLDPTFVVHSARGPHSYWVLKPRPTLEAFGPAQRQLAAFYGSDASVHDLPRVMRLPGFLHRKGEPRLVTFEGASLRNYTLEEVLEAHPVKAVATTRRGVEISALGKIPVGRRYEAWKTEAARLHNDGASRSQLVEVLWHYGQTMFEQPETARREDAEKLADWFQGKDRARPFTIELAATEPVEASEREPGAADDPTDFDDGWPRLDEAALHGLAGEIVRVIQPQSEADPAALLVQTLVMFGNGVDRTPHAQVGATQHFANLFAVIVGVSSKGRKGTSANEVRRFFKFASPSWEGSNIKSGLSTGEGLIHAVRDPLETEEKVKGKDGAEIFQTVVKDKGVTDKRLLAMQSEFAVVLKNASRDGNILSDVLKDSWDSGNLGILTRSSPHKATGAHVSVIGHATIPDLKRLLTPADAANGFGNRFLWVCARRWQQLPDGGDLQDSDIGRLAQRLEAAIDAARRIARVNRCPEATELWHREYGRLSRDRAGLAGKLTDRAEAQVLRLSLLYALLDGSKEVRLQHLQAALALWDYCERSVLYIFGDATGDPAADKVLVALRAEPGGSMTRAQITNEVFGKRPPPLDPLRDFLRKLKRIRIEVVSTAGRPREVWTLAR
jgi:hypothetical protein